MTVKIERILPKNSVFCAGDLLEDRYRIAARAWFDLAWALFAVTPFSKLTLSWFRSVRTTDVHLEISLNIARSRDASYAAASPGAPAPYSGSSRKLLNDLADRHLWSVTTPEDLLAAMAGSRFNCLTSFDMTYCWEKRNGMTWANKTYPAFIDGADLANALLSMIDVKDHPWQTL